MDWSNASFHGLLNAITAKYKLSKKKKKKKKKKKLGLRLAHIVC